MSGDAGVALLAFVVALQALVILGLRRRIERLSGGKTPGVTIARVKAIRQAALDRGETMTYEAALAQARREADSNPGP